jgi:hypothetical protein
LEDVYEIVTDTRAWKNSFDWKTFGATIRPLRLSSLWYTLVPTAEKPAASDTELSRLVNSLEACGMEPSGLLSLYKAAFGTSVDGKHLPSALLRTLTYLRSG